MTGARLTDCTASARQTARGDLAVAPTKERRSGGRRDLPPLGLALLALLIVLGVLPSALNAPRANPTETLEYAPVPPDDAADAPPNSGNLSSLGLASESVLGEVSDFDVGAGALGGVGKNAATKRCVGSPPRQTEDLLSPPCVAHFQGDNFGATYPGVSRNEIKVLVINEYDCYSGSSSGYECSPNQGTYVDLGKPPKEGESEYIVTRYYRVWQRYYNDRYQTYGRYVHFYLYYGTATTPEGRRGQAADNYSRVKPFAILPGRLYAGNMDPYIEVMAGRGVLFFDDAYYRRESNQRRFAGLLWGYGPTLEKQAPGFTSFICQKVKPYPVSFSGNLLENGTPRRYGLLFSSAPEWPERITFKELVVEQLRRCGVEFVAEGASPRYGIVADTEDPSYAAPVMARFKQDGVTTIIWAGGYDENFSKAAAATDYRPEWIVAGGTTHDGAFYEHLQDQTVWDHAWLITPELLLPKGGVDTACRNAWADARGETMTDDTWEWGIGCRHGRGVRQLFTGIQVAGPRLTPQTIDRGFHAIPRLPSRNRETPACFYDANDYSCVKDQMAEWWDSQAKDSNSNNPGCWRGAEDGTRYLAGQWPSGDVLTMKDPARNPCNGTLTAFIGYS
jgi:hypothetical protein